MNDLFHLENNPTNSPNVDWVSFPNSLRTDKNVIVKDFLIVNDKEIKMLKGQSVNRRAVNTLVTGAVYSVGTNEYLIGVTNLSYAASIGLPNPIIAGVGKIYVVKDEVGGASTTTITIRSSNEKLIDGGAITTLTTNYASKSFYTDGSNWFIY